ncbi:MAG: hypothetical protein EOO54_06850 [Haliea sp.]|nr:MAG: hypothetical protein EOO54_06850 [Haliea sp.]
MSIELPVLRLGLVGFTVEQQQILSGVATTAASSGLVWEITKLEDADAWWVNGARCQLLADGSMRIASGVPGGRSLQLNLADIDRPVAFCGPLPRSFQPDHFFALESVPSMKTVLRKFESWLSSLAAQFCLASHIVENEGALAPGVYHVSNHGTLLAVVDLQGEVGVLPSAGPIDFEEAVWHHRPAGAASIPAGFVQASLSQLMWQYAVRTSRDVLPRRYRKGVLYFRRPPRIAQRLLRDAHLLLMRELSCEAGSFEELQQRTGMAANSLAHHLGALYLVGAITANPKRAAAVWPVARRAESAAASQNPVNSVTPSGLEQDSGVPPQLQVRARFADLTAPAPMGGL